MTRTCLLMMALILFAGCSDPYASSSSTADSRSAPPPQQPKAEEPATSRPSSAQEGAAPPTITPMSTTLPVDFRKDIPIYPDSRIGGVGGGLVAFETTARANLVEAFYRTELPKNGWEVEEQDLGIGTGFMITKNSRRYVVTVSKLPGQGTGIGVTESP